MQRMYLTPDGNLGTLQGMLRFWVEDLPADLFVKVQEDPEGTYDELSVFLIRNGLM